MDCLAYVPNAVMILEHWNFWQLFSDMMSYLLNFLLFISLNLWSCFVVYQKVYFSINIGAVVWLPWIIFNSSTEGGTQRYNGKMAFFHVSEPHWWVVTAFLSFDLHIMYFRVCFTTTVAESVKSSFQDIGICLQYLGSITCILILSCLTKLIFWFHFLYAHMLLFSSDAVALTKFSFRCNTEAKQWGGYWFKVFYCTYS